MVHPLLIRFLILSLLALLSHLASDVLASQNSLGDQAILRGEHRVSAALFADLEELSRVVDISYCVGLFGTGIHKPFRCASRCQDFEDFELISTWNTGPFLADSCGYIAVSHRPSAPRIIAAFRGTYSITNAIIDLSTIPQRYVPYPRDGGGKDVSMNDESARLPLARCLNCTVHAGFMYSWEHTRSYVIPYIESLVERFPDHRLLVLGHSLGGAVSALASLEFNARGWNPQVTTFGEPRIGNLALMQYINEVFMLETVNNDSARYRRVTHVNDPVPLLPLSEWGFAMHAGEIYISKSQIPPSIADLSHCEGDRDPNCISGAEYSTDHTATADGSQKTLLSKPKKWLNANRGFLNIPGRFRIWQFLFAHRDYFWRLGLCIPGGDPSDWFRKHYNIHSGEL